MKHPLFIQRRNSGGMTLIEVVISVCMFTIAMVGLGYAMGQILDISTAVRGQTRMLNNCQQVLQETLHRPIDELESYNPPDAPSRTTIGTFEIEKVSSLKYVTNLSMVLFLNNFVQYSNSKNIFPWCSILFKSKSTLEVLSS